MVTINFGGPQGGIRGIAETIGWFILISTALDQLAKLKQRWWRHTPREFPSVLQYLQENGVHGWVKIDNNPSTGIQQYVTTTEITGENQFYGFGFLLEFCTIAPTIQSQCETSNSRVINRLKAPLVHLKGGYEVRAWWFVSKKLRFDVTLFDVEQVVTVDYEKGANGQWKISNVGVDVRIGDAAIFFERIGPFEFMIEQDKKCWGHQAKNLTEEMKKPSGPSDGLREFPRRRFFMERQCPMGRL